MKPKLKLLVGGILLCLGLAGTKFLNTTQDIPAKAQNNQKKELPSGKDVKAPELECVPARAEIRERVATFADYTLVGYEIDFSKTVQRSQRSFPPGITALPDGQTKEMHTHHEGMHDPNLFVAVMKIDPLSGCRTVVKDMKQEPLPAKWSDSQKKAVKKLYWAYIGKELESVHEVSLQAYILDRTGTPGPSELSLNLADMQALTELGLKLHPWQNPKLTQEQRDKIYYEYLANRGWEKK